MIPHLTIRARELDMAEKFINHFCHEHPLILTQNLVCKEPLDCFACGKPLVNSESVNVCVEHQYCINKSRSMIHKRCAELPKQILHPSHPQHPLHLFEDQETVYRCNLCRDYFGSELRYRCHRCDFDIDITCKKLSIDELFGERSLAHPSHLHPLALMRKPASLITCDACGTEDRDMAYACSTCELSIHKACAMLPTSLPTNQHHHQLSLAFCFPIKYRKYRYRCVVCDEYFDMTFWVYYCGDCRYFCHLKCATSTAQTTKRDFLSKDETTDGSDLIQLPLHDTSKELITPFVLREKGPHIIPHVNDMPATVKMPETTAIFTFSFNYHKHPLSLVSEDHDKSAAELDDVDESKICDLCVTPVSYPPYYQCVACKYFVHFICYLLPKTLSSSSSSFSPDSPGLHGNCQNAPTKKHRFTVFYASSQEKDMGVVRCQLCHLQTNGMVYKCEECSMQIDVKCASLPPTISHASHLHHKSLIMATIPPEEGGRKRKCHCCEGTFYDDIGYRCSNDDCDFALHLKCAMLPLSVTNQDSDKHPLLLTFDASVDHPSDFFCDFCEEEMHPKEWMYHCRQCDNSLHINCIPATIDEELLINFKFGRRFELNGIHPHPHPLTFNYATLKKWCDICHAGVYTRIGLECASCNYLVCLGCGFEGIFDNM